MTQAQPIKLIIKSPEFFSTPPKKITVEENAGTGRTYFLRGDRILAVGLPIEESE